MTCDKVLWRHILIGMLLVATSTVYGNNPSARPQVQLETDLGLITIELYADKAPITAANFIEYIESGFYVGTIFHRVVPNFVIQGGGRTFDFQRKEPRAPIKNESDNGLRNTRGTLSMARKSDPDSATSQFFINLKHNKNLNAKGDQPGYAVFGKVIKGMDVVNAIVKEPRGLYRAFPDAPNAPVRILKAELIRPTSQQAN